MKKAFLIFIVFTLLVPLCSCKEVAVNTTDIGDYKKTFMYCVGNTHTNLTKIQTIVKNDGTIIDYAARYAAELPLGDDVQIKLSVQYEKSVFEEKVHALSNVREDQRRVLFDTKNFILPAYVTAIGYLNVCEYVLVDEEALTLHYFLLQNIEQKELIFDQKYLPKGFDDNKVEGLKYTVYQDLIDAYK